MQSRSFVLNSLSILTFLMIGLGTTPSYAEIVVKEAWARATAEHGNTAGVFLTITNTGKESDTLTEVDTTVATEAMMHETISRMVDGKPRVHMRMLDDLPIPAGKTVVLAPSGMHIMLAHLHSPLVEGESFQAVLRFANHTPIKVDVDIASAGADSYPTH